MPHPEFIQHWAKQEVLDRIVGVLRELQDMLQDEEEDDIDVEYSALVREPKVTKHEVNSVGLEEALKEDLTCAKLIASKKLTVVGARALSLFRPFGEAAMNPAYVKAHEIAVAERMNGFGNPGSENSEAYRVYSNALARARNDTIDHLADQSPEAQAAVARSKARTASRKEWAQSMRKTIGYAPMTRDQNFIDGSLTEAGIQSWLPALRRAIYSWMAENLSDPYPVRDELDKWQAEHKVPRIRTLNTARSMRASFIEIADSGSAAEDLKHDE